MCQCQPIFFFWKIRQITGFSIKNYQGVEEDFIFWNVSARVDFDGHVVGHNVNLGAGRAFARWISTGACTVDKAFQLRPITKLNRIYISEFLKKTTA